MSGADPSHHGGKPSEDEQSSSISKPIYPQHVTTDDKDADTLQTALSRNQILEKRLSALATFFQDRAYLKDAIERTLLELKRFETVLELLPESSRRALIDARQIISCPTESQLEANGRMARKVALLNSHPTLNHQFSSLLGKLERESLDAHLRACIDCGREKLPMRDSLASHLNEELLAIIDSVPLPEDSGEESVRRKEFRLKLTDTNRYFFGDASASHWGNDNFHTNFLYSARELRDFALTGHLFAFPPSSFMIGYPASEWTTLEELQSLEHSDPFTLFRIRENVAICATRVGLRVCGSRQDKEHRIVLGLDGCVCWEIDDLHEHRTSSFYGEIRQQRKITDLPQPVISLADDVSIRLSSEPETVLKYSRGLISLKQAQELVLDHIEEKDGNFFLPFPDFRTFLLDDTRWELQTRLPVAIE